jgi:hypothetical protein
MGSAIPEVDTKARSEGKLIAFKDANPDFTKMYDKLVALGAFEFIRSGKLKVGDTVSFEIEYDFNEDINRDNKAAGRTEALVITLKVGDQTIGFLNYSDEYLGVKELRERI